MTTASLLRRFYNDSCGKVMKTSSLAAMKTHRHSRGTVMKTHRHSRGTTMLTLGLSKGTVMMSPSHDSLSH